MSKQLIVCITFIMCLVIYSCSHKTHPAKTTAETATKTDTASIAKAAVKKKPKVVLPKMIVVNDSVAHKSVDGRLYYDVMGHRYWRSNKDGKYYLFNQSMYNNPDFKAGQ